MKSIIYECKPLISNRRTIFRNVTRKTTKARTQHQTTKPSDASSKSGAGPAVVADELRALIVDGSFKAGARITERAVTERFDCTSATTREAFHLLEKQGAIIVSARRGARVIAEAYAPPEELFIVWDRLRWLLGEELRRHDASIQPSLPEGKSKKQPSDRLKQIEAQLERLGASSGNIRLVRAMARIALHVAIVAPERLVEIEESLSR
ncbi:hypothetical protein CW354_04910 [Marinicaulis flavus]|uniref:HTH gntR-type domain-containing protein n=1 Tax=Hyphococcus luteus TaxID=2058213 RepID=A0A2S7K5F8_9PROT|nr:hypothetical protein CW354_04910 [Marinicaulis flavus]